MAHGGRFGGHSFYIHGNKLCYVYNWLGQRKQKVSCPIPIAALTAKDKNDKVELKVEFEKKRVIEKGDTLFATYSSSTLGEVKLSITIDDIPVSDLETTWEWGEGEAWRAWAQDWDGPNQFITQPAKFALSGEGFNIGRDGGQPVSHDDTSPGEFEGATIKNVVFTIMGDAAPMDPEKEFKGMLWRD